MAESIYPITVPKWGIEMQEGTVVEWHIEPGAVVIQGADLIDIETDKIVNTLEAPISGVLKRQLVQTGETLKVGELLGVIAQAGSSEDEVEAFIAAFVPIDASFGVGDELDSGTRTAADTAPAKQPETQTVAHADPRTETRAESGQASEAGVRVSPVARRLAEKLGVDLTKVQGSGRNGRISSEDVEAAATAKGEPATAGSGSAPAQTESIPLSSRALTAARRMNEAKPGIPHFYLSRDLDMTLATELQKSSGVPLTAIILRSMVSALKAEPSINAHFKDNSLFRPARIAINVAVDTPEGLVAPVLADLDELEASEIATRLKALAQKARDRQLSGSDLAAGGTTLSNLGMMGISAFGAIINPPQVAILAIGSIRPLQLSMNGPLQSGMTATLSCDHRALDGAAGARFLAALQSALLQT